MDFQKINLLLERNKKVVVLIIMSVACIFVLLIFSWSFYEKQKTRYQSSLSLKFWLDSNLSALQDVSNNNQVFAKDGAGADKRSLVSVVSDTAKLYDINLNLLEPRDGKVSAVIDEALFSVIAQWLWMLSSEQKVIAHEAIFTYLEDNKASVRIVFMRKN